MADLSDPTTLALIAIVIVMTGVTWFELRYLRKSSKSHRGRAGSRDRDLPDEAHNSLITTKAIVATMGRGGVRSEEVDGLMREAQMAYDRHNYRVAVETTQRAKERLMALKRERETKGGEAAVEAPSAASVPDEPTTKERLQKEFAPNEIQARFTMSKAEASIEAARSAGHDMAQADGLLVAAKGRFDAKDFDGALRAARLAEKSARGEAVEAERTAPPAGGTVASKAAPVPAGSKCPSCGAPVPEGDAFCRKCGAQVVPTSCPTCGASLQGDDIFCRKCGTRLVR